VGGGALVSCFKAARRGRGTVVRVYEPHGRSATSTVAGVPEGAEVWEVTVTEDRVCRLEAVAGVVTLALRPWQVRTLLVEL
jgi:alpha-mannosidase